ncbi:MAG: pyridoxamine 5'-phosphate oxidase [Chitinophagaceae bacterium]
MIIAYLSVNNFYIIGTLTSEQIEDLLKENIIGWLACSNGQYSYIVPVTYLYNGQTILVHSRMGLKIEMMRKSKQVCFEVEDIKTYTKWKTVLVYGTYREITEEDERYATMDRFVKNMISLKISETPRPPEAGLKLPVKEVS